MPVDNYNAAAHARGESVVVLNPGVETNIDEDGEFIAFQFDSIVLQQGETVTSATLTITLGETDGEALVKADDSDAPTALAATANNITSRVRTTAGVTLSNETADASVDIDVTAVVQEVANRAGWSTGNRLVFPIEGQDSGHEPFSIDLSVTAQLEIDHPLTGGGGGGGGSTGGSSGGGGFDKHWVGGFTG